MDCVFLEIILIRFGRSLLFLLKERGYKSPKLYHKVKMLRSGSRVSNIIMTLG